MVFRDGGAGGEHRGKWEWEPCPFPLIFREYPSISLPFPSHFPPISFPFPSTIVGVAHALPRPVRKPCSCPGNEMLVPPLVIFLLLLGPGLEGQPARLLASIRPSLPRAQTVSPTELLAHKAVSRAALVDKN